MTSVFVCRTSAEASAAEFILEAEANLITGERDFRKAFGPPTTLEADLLLLASSIFAADRACARGENEDNARRIEISVPIVNIGRFIPLQGKIEEMLRILSNDSWRITFRHAEGAPENVPDIELNNGQTLLFSGGLDSLAAAVDFGAAGNELQLVSHITKNRPTAVAQKELLTIMNSRGISLSHLQFFVSSRDGGPHGLKHSIEETQRTRSFMFLILAALVARRLRHGKVLFLAENGQMAIHLPLTQGRIGSFSTHTAHPDFLVAMQEFLFGIFQIPLEIVNPYVHNTKAEVIQTLSEQLPELIPISHSCWRNSRLPRGVTHCGECIPCFIRRIAIEYHLASDPTSYHKDPWQQPIARLEPEDIGRRNLVDLAEFIVRMDQQSNNDILTEWPELFSDNIHADQVIAMYKRFAVEAKRVFGRYSSLEALLK